jgi:NTP pyrophosphatase (non-canonical NTP hydrolase)
VTRPATIPVVNTDAWGTIARLVQWLDDANNRTDQEIGLRILKLSEEVGEVSQAWIGAMGQNPRKGYTHTVADVADELVDVIVTAMVALTSISDTPEHHFAQKIQKIAALRLPAVDGAS